MKNAVLQTSDSTTATQYRVAVITVTPAKLKSLQNKEGGADFTYQGKHYRWLGDVHVSEATIANNPNLDNKNGCFLNMASETHGKNQPPKKLEVQFQVKT